MIGRQGSVVVKADISACSELLGSKFMSFCVVFGGDTGCGSASLNLCACNTASPWSNNPSTVSTGVWSLWKVDLLEPKCPALNILTFCQQGLTLKNERMTLSRSWIWKGYSHQPLELQCVKCIRRNNAFTFGLFVWLLHLETLDLVRGQAGGVVDFLEVDVTVRVGLGHGAGDVCLMSLGSGLAPRPSLFRSSTTETVLIHYSHYRDCTDALLHQVTGQSHSSAENRLIATLGTRRGKRLSGLILPNWELVCLCLENVSQKCESFRK